MKLYNPTEGVVRIDTNDGTEYLFPAGDGVEVDAAHVGEVLRAHPEMTMAEPVSAAATKTEG